MPHKAQPNPSRRLAVVTGASAGIGRATALQLGQAGWRVVVVARRREPLEALAQKIGEACVVEALDAADGDAVVAMAGRVQGEYGAPDLIVNSAGAGVWKYIEDTPPQEAVQMMGAPYFAAYNTTHAFMQGMLERKRGVIIHVGSPAALTPWPGATAYHATRWALRGLHEALCQDLRGTGVRSCLVAFGKVSSDYFKTNPDSEQHIPAVAAKTVPVSTPEQCAEKIVRLADRPRRNAVYPFMLRTYYWTYAIWPGLVRWLAGASGRQRQP